MVEFLREQWQQRPSLVIIAVTAPIAFVITFLAILATSGDGERNVLVSFPEQQSGAQADAVVLQQQEQQPPVVEVRTSGTTTEAAQQSVSAAPREPAQPERTAEPAARDTNGSAQTAQQTEPARETPQATESEELPYLEDVLVEQIDWSALRYGGDGGEGAILPIDNGVVPSTGPRFATSWELLVPSARISASIKKVGRAPNGAMGAPDNPDIIGWLDSSAAPGESGNALLVGHRDYTDINGKVGYGVCWELDKSRLRDVIIVIDTDSELAYVYEIIEKVTVDPTDRSSREYLKQTEEPVVTLITCNGSFDVNTHSYSHRLVLVGLLRHITRT